MDQFTKLQAWNLTNYNWVLYMDSDTFIVCSIVPMVSFVLTSEQKQPIWVVQDVRASIDSFIMGTFMIQPNSTEFSSLISTLHYEDKFHFVESWMEQGFLNAVYKDTWGEIPANFGSIHLVLWSKQRQMWCSSKMQVIHFTMVKPWDWFCPWTEYVLLCYLFWNMDSMKFH
jgi:lipopolysaccharide biosynthesis glycosyltransferase